MDNLKSCKIGEMLTPYFGKLNTGIHSYRIFNIAFLDIFVSIFFAILIAYVFNIKIWHSIIGVLIMGIIVHRLLCIPTRVDKFLFGEKN